MYCTKARVCLRYAFFEKEDEHIITSFFLFIRTKEEIFYGLLNTLEWGCMGFYSSVVPREFMNESILDVFWDVLQEFDFFSQEFKLIKYQTLNNILK